MIRFLVLASIIVETLGFYWMPFSQFLSVPGSDRTKKKHRRSSEGCIYPDEILRTTRTERSDSKNSGQTESHLLDILRKNYEIVSALADIERSEDRESPDAGHRTGMRGKGPLSSRESPKPFVINSNPKWSTANYESVSLSSEDSTYASRPPTDLRTFDSQSWNSRMRNELKNFAEDVVDAFTTSTIAEEINEQDVEKLSAIQLKKDLKRFYQSVHVYLEILAAFYDLFMWKNPLSTLLLVLVYMYSIFRGWTLTLILLLILAQLSINYLAEVKRIDIGWQFLPRKEIPTPKFDISGAQIIFDIAKMAQRLLRFATNVLEKIHSLLTWKNQKVTRHFFYLSLYWLALSVVFNTGTCIGMCGATIGIRIFLTTYLFSKFPKLRRRLDTWGYFYRNLPLRLNVTPRQERPPEKNNERSNTPCSVRRSTFSGEKFESRLGSNFNLDQHAAVTMLLGSSRKNSEAFDSAIELEKQSVRRYQSEPSSSRVDDSSSFDDIEEDEAGSSTAEDTIIENVIAFRSCVMNEREKIFPKGITSGVLYLTDAALVFRSRSPNESKEQIVMLFHDVSEVRKTTCNRSMSLITGTRKSLEIVFDGRKKPLQFLGIAKRDDFFTRLQLMCRNSAATPLFADV